MILPVLVLDAGNSFTHAAVFSGDAVIDIRSLPTRSLENSGEVRKLVDGILNDHPDLCHAAICSVVPSAGVLFHQVLGSVLPGSLIDISSSLKLPFSLDYNPPSSLGADRIAFCSYCAGYSSENPVIAIDIGTAITMDVLVPDEGYFGGLIMPGLDMMSAALHDRTARLPRVEVSGPVPLLGRSTEDCMESGIFWGGVKQVEGLLAEIRHVIIEKKGRQRVNVVATGGGSRIIIPALKEPILIDEQAVLKGGKVLLDLNVEEAG